jgi:23S rRNA (pseudouridine1915-N3)-methyltransferase
MNVTIISLGKLKEKYLRDAIDEYAKRISAYAKCDIIELNPVRLSDNPSSAEIQNALSKEAEEIKKKIPNNSYVFSLCIEGKAKSSEDFAKSIKDATLNGKSNIVFIIGSSFGLSDTIKKMSNKKLSMSKMTFPHQLARVMLLEQIYRAVQISAGTKYHK